MMMDLSGVIGLLALFVATQRAYGGPCDPPCCIFQHMCSYGCGSQVGFFANPTGCEDPEGIGNFSCQAVKLFFALFILLIIVNLFLPFIQTPENICQSICFISQGI